MTSRDLYLDYETEGSIDLKVVGAARYCAHADTRIDRIGYQIGNGDTRVWRAGDELPADLLTAIHNIRVGNGRPGEPRLVAYNADFEYWVTRYVLAPLAGIEPLPPQCFRCLRDTLHIAGVRASQKMSLTDALDILDAPESVRKNLEALAQANYSWEM